MSTLKKIPVVRKELLFPFIIITSLFALWGIANDLTNPMVSAFKKVMPKVSPLIAFLAVLSISLGLAFLIQTTLLESFDYSRYGNLIITSYLVNAALAIFIFSILYLFKERLKNYIGFLFIGGSFLKFIFFFILFYPVYRADGEMDKLEFAAFFVPYLISLLIETIFTAKMLKKLDNKNV